MSNFNKNSIGNRVASFITDEATFDKVAVATVGAATLQKIISGEKYPTVPQLAALSKELGVSVDYLLFGDEDEHEPEYTIVPAVIADASNAICDADGEMKVVCMPVVVAEAIEKIFNIDTIESAMTPTKIDVEKLAFAHDVVKNAADFEANVKLNITDTDEDDCECDDECSCDCHTESECECNRNEEKETEDNKDCELGECVGCDYFKECYGISEEEYRAQQKERQKKISEASQKLFFNDPFEYVLMRALMRNILGF